MKSFIPVTAIALLLLTISCTKENASKSTQSTVSVDKVSAFTIGQRYGGGIIFYIDTTGLHGLIADTVDLPQARWWAGSDIVTGATSKKVGAGRRNTKKIYAAQGTSYPYAALECWESKRGGYKDWFLPSKGEMVLLYQEKNVVGGFGTANTSYWSSTERDAVFAYIESFGNGYSGTWGKSDPFNVRAIRSF